MKRLQTIASLAAAGALLVVPAIGQADKPDANGNHSHPTGKGQGKAKSCAKKPSKGFVVKGTLVSYTADTAAPGNQETVTITVTRANRHARNSGDLDDSGPNSSDPGIQYTVPTSDAFSVRLDGYETGQTPPDGPSAGDRVRIIGKVPVTKKRCADANDTLADRYGTVNVRKVKIIDAD